MRLLLLPAALLLGACGDDEPSPPTLEPGETLRLESDAALVTAEVRAEGDRVAAGRNTFLVEFDPATTELVGAETLMPSHGHGSFEPTIEKAASGWRVSDVVFNMAGLWDVTLDVSVGGRSDRVTFTVDVR